MKSRIYYLLFLPFFITACQSNEDDLSKNDSQVLLTDRSEIKIQENFFSINATTPYRTNGYKMIVEEQNVIKIENFFK